LLFFICLQKREASALKIAELEAALEKLKQEDQKRSQEARERQMAFEAKVP
jgi:DNA-binding protein H-NS